MDCHNHPGVGAAIACTGCAEAFCNPCLVTIKGQRYCAGCKAMAIPAVAAVQVPCKEASEALKYALIGLVIFGPILEPVALFRALAAKRRIRADPTLSGDGKATAALLVSTTVISLWVAGFLSAFAHR